MHRVELNQTGPNWSDASFRSFISVQPDVIWLEELWSGPKHVFDCHTAVLMDPNQNLFWLFETGGVNPVGSGLQFGYFG